MSSLSPLTAVSPIDGRYYDKTKELSVYFSEFALFKYRVHVEVEYLIALSAIPLPQLKCVLLIAAACHCIPFFFALVWGHMGVAKQFKQLLGRMGRRGLT